MIISMSIEELAMNFLHEARVEDTLPYVTKFAMMADKDQHESRISNATSQKSERVTSDTILVLSRSPLLSFPHLPSILRLIRVVVVLIRCVGWLILYLRIFTCTLLLFLLRLLAFLRFVR
jgi:hypothetical protein